MSPRVPLFVIASLTVLGPAASMATANGDFCSSAVFRRTFPEGLESMDYAYVSPELLKFGDAVLPCCDHVLKTGGGDLGIPLCQESPHQCRVWAVRVFDALATPAAMERLSGVLKTQMEPRVLIAAIVAFGNRRESAVRPDLLRLLKHEHMSVRAHAVHVLGVIGDRSDFEPMLEATLSLSEVYQWRGAKGLEILGDPRAIEPLRKLAGSTTNPTHRRGLEKNIRRLEAQSAGTQAR